MSGEAARSKRAAAEGGADRLSALPDGQLQRVLSFLPSRDAVRTCVLARRWRNQWKSVPTMGITESRRADTGRLFDRMPPGSKAVSSKRAAAESGADRLSALSDGPLQHVLSFLPSCDAVRTCVLARRWRNQWKSVPAVRITDSWRYESAQHLNRFVNRFLWRRGLSPLNVLEISSYDGDDDDSHAAFKYMERWIQYGLSNRAQVLCIRCNDRHERWLLPDGLLVSKHLLRLELHNLHLEASRVDFSCCPLLEDLRIKHCAIETTWIMSPSVRHLAITNCHFSPSDRTRISFPGLISFVLADCWDRTPVLESMPFLVSAFVRLQTCLDCCDNKFETGDCGGDNCYGCADSNAATDACVLEGLSASTSLELTSAQSEFIFRKDLICCPVFGKLRTLLLNEWCITANLGALRCILQHAPVLQKLTIQIQESHEDLVDNGAIYDVAIDPVALEHLTVEVKCHEVDERTDKILELLEGIGVPYENINILPEPKLLKSEDTDGPVPSASFTFEQKA